MIWLAAALAAASPADAEPAWRLMPPEDRTAVPEAASHVVTLVSHVRRSLYRRERVARSGDWIRNDRTQDGRRTTHFSHLGSNTSFSYSRGADGRIAAIRVARDRSATPYNRMHRTATGRYERALGQRCQVWRIAPVGELAGDSSWLSCETRDGLQLTVSERWRDNLIVERRAVAVSRRPVARETVRPPALFFAIASLPAGPAWSEPGPDYRVVLRSDSVDAGGPGRIIIQRRGAIRSFDSQNDDGSRNYSVTQGAFHIGYWQEPGGRPTALWVNRLSDEDSPVIQGRRATVEGRAPETILGETCTWTRSTIVMSHYRRIDCETADGIVLATDEQSYAGHNVYRATSLSRDRLTPADFRLPERALGLRGWGVAGD